MVRESSDEGHRRDIRHPVADDHVIALFSRSDEQRNLNRVMLPISIDGYRAIITTIHEIPESCLERSALAHIELVAKDLSLIHISEPTRLGMISYAVFCLKKKKKKKKKSTN